MRVQTAMQCPAAKFCLRLSLALVSILPGIGQSWCHHVYRKCRGHPAITEPVSTNQRNNADDDWWVLVGCTSSCFVGIQRVLFTSRSCYVFKILLFSTSKAVS